MTSTEYTVNRYQHTFKYNDVDIMTDPYLMDVLTDGAGKTVANEIKQEYWNELAKISNKVSGDKLTYDLVVDAIASLGNVEDDTSNKFLCVGVDGRQQIRKDDDYINSHQGDILYSGQFGTVAGIPVIFSRLVPTGKAYITQKDAVKFFVKRQGTVEQDRDIETKDNTVVYERHGVMALVDDTRSVIVDFSGTAGA